MFRITFNDFEILTYESKMYMQRMIESLFMQQEDNGKLLNDNLTIVCGRKAYP